MVAWIPALLSTLCSLAGIILKR